MSEHKTKFLGKGRRLTIHDLAKLLKVSPSTVSRAVNGAAGINKNTASKILRAASELGFVLNTDAANLRKRNGKEGHKGPTMEDIAKKLKLSSSTVSRCLSFHCDVSPKTRSRVLRAAKRMGFEHNDNARRLQQQRR